MSKFGEGLNIEFARAVKSGEISEPFCSDDVKRFAENRGWKPSPHYISVLLANGSSLSHSFTYKKLFTAKGSGYYILSDLARKEC